MSSHDSFSPSSTQLLDVCSACDLYLFCVGVLTLMYVHVLAGVCMCVREKVWEFPLVLFVDCWAVCPGGNGPHDKIWRDSSTVFPIQDKIFVVRV